MNCPKCGTYNPEDRTVCWRCNAELPKPKPVKKRDPQKSAQTWLYVAVALFFIITIAQSCGLKLPFGVQQGAPTPGSALPERPAIVYVMERAEPGL